MRRNPNADELKQFLYLKSNSAEANCIFQFQNLIQHVIIRTIQLGCIDHI